MTTYINVIIQSGAALLSFGVDVWLHRQRLARGLVELLKQIPAAGTQVTGYLTVQLHQ